MRHQSQKGFRGIFVGIPQHQTLYFVYVPSTRKIVSSHDVVFDETFSSALSYTSRPYPEALAMRPSVLYIPYDTSSHEQTGKTITFAQFEEDNLSENERNTEEEESISASIDESSTDNNYDDGSISTKSLWDICYGSSIHPELNARYARFKISANIKKTKNEWKGA